jgi:3',5'-cyclic-nucleotide phosphodiesterase
MEREIGMETALFGGPPDLDDPVKKANGQIGFMDFFALPLFDGVTELLPDMAFAAVEIRRNRSIWKRLIEREKTKELPIEMRPPEQSEEDIVRDEETHQFKMAHVPGPVPTSWKPPPDLLQYDGWPGRPQGGGTKPAVS